MKKNHSRILTATFCIFLILTPRFSYALMTYKVGGLSSGLASITSEKTLIPAMIRATNTTTAVSAVRAVALNIPRATVAGIAATVIFSAAGWGIQKAGDRFTQWLQSNNYEMSGTSVHKWVDGTPVPPSDYSPGTPNVFHGYYPTSTAAWDIINAIPNKSMGITTVTLSNNRVVWKCMTYGTPANVHHYAIGMTGGIPAPEVPPVLAPATQGDLSTSLDSTMAQPSTQELIRDALRVVENALKNPASTAAQSPALQTILQTLADTLTAAQKALVDAAMPADQDQWADDEAGTATSSLTAEEVQQAVEQGVENALKKDDPETNWPEDQEIENPEKTPLTPVLTTFMNGIKALPIISAISGIRMEVSGATSTLCINNLPFGVGSRCYDASGSAGAISGIGNFLLGMVTLASILGFIGWRD